MLVNGIWIIHYWSWFFRFRPEAPFWANLVKNQNCQFKLKFSTLINSNIRNSIMMFTFSVFDQKYFFGVNFLEKIIIASLSWNLVPALQLHLSIKIFVDYTFFKEENINKLIRLRNAFTCFRLRWLAWLISSLFFMDWFCYNLKILIK